jgi:hypothetical protein
MTARTIIESFGSEFRKTKSACEGAIRQVDDTQLHAQINSRQNSIAVIVQHMHGNMLSRWTDFLNSDGEKPTRDREGEFADRRLSRNELMRIWDEGWKCVFAALAPLTDADLTRTVLIRKEPHSVALAITRQIAHYSWHAGQIALIAKHLAGENWQYLTIPPGGSGEFNRKMGV